MLSRSASGPGGLSINTGAANLFGSTTSQPPAAGGGLFGSSTTNSTSQPAPSGGLFSTTPASSQPAATTTSGGLFGSSSQPQQTGGLFGNSQATAQGGPQQQQTASLFGSTAQSQPQQLGGLFGQTMAQPQQQTGSLFGSTTASQPQPGGGLSGSLITQPQQQQPAQQAGGLFGASANQPQQQQQQLTGGLFGASSSQPQQQQTGGLFGGKPAQSTSTGLFNQTKPAGGLFSQSTAQPQTSAFGQSTPGPGLTMGQSNNNSQSQSQQQVVPGVRIDVSNIRSTTRFNDLQEDLQKQIAEIDKAIQGFISQKNELDAFMPAHGEQLTSIPTDVAFVSRKAAGVEGALAADAVAVKQLRELVKVDADNAKLSFKAVDNLKLPTPYHQAGLWSTRGQQASTSGGTADVDGEGSSDLVSFFSRAADEMGETMKKFEKNLGDIESHLHGVQANVLEQLQKVSATPKDGVQGNDEKIVELAAVLRDFEESILEVAGVVGGAREGVTQLQLGEFLGKGVSMNGTY